MFNLTIVGISSILGSTWLFGAWQAARVAGPSALLCWPIGAILVLLFAMSYAEMSANYPATGGMVRYTQLSHGPFAGFIAGWANWIGSITIIAIEAASSVQYMSSWSFDFTHHLYDKKASKLSLTGFSLAVVFIMLYFILNFWSTKLFLRSTFYISLLKIGIPFLTSATLIIAACQQHHFIYNHSEFMPYGINSVFTAVATTGVIFAFNGFQAPINLSGEVKNPSRNIPMSVFLSIFITLILYLILQYAFLGNITLQEVQHGWNQLDYNSPLVHLALSLNLNWLMILLYADAFISPSGAAIINTASTSRMLYAMEKNGYMPKFLGKLHPLYCIPRAAMWVNLIVSFTILFIFRSWDSLVSVITISSVVAYSTGPIAAMALRKWDRNSHSLVKIKVLKLLSPLAFIVISWVLYWACWPLTGKVILMMFSGLPLYLYYQYIKSWDNFKKQFYSGLWLICYLLGIVFISWAGSSTFGGKGLLNTLESMLVLSILAIVLYFWGIESSYLKTMVNVEEYLINAKEQHGTQS